MFVMIKHIFLSLISFIVLNSCSSNEVPNESFAHYPSDVDYTKVDKSTMQIRWVSNNKNEKGFKIWARLCADATYKIELGQTVANKTNAEVSVDNLTVGVSYYIGVQTLSKNPELNSKITYSPKIYFHSVDSNVIDPNETPKEMSSFTDMVLIYGGGHHRSYTWDKSTMKYYVSYADAAGISHWLFDSFLFIEFMDPGAGGSNKTFATGYSYNKEKLESASQTEWQQLINYFFTDNLAIDALEKSIELATNTLGTPSEKRKIVITIPEPITHLQYWNTLSSSTYWGKIDGVTLDFQKDNDRIKACKWYIDKVRSAFNKHNYKYLELAGFYWLAEKATQTSTILSSIGEYLNKMNYSFNWIPYYTAEGYNQWNLFGFNNTFYQPNYFFSETIPDSRLDIACQDALKYSMNMELEFDDKVLDAGGFKYGYRLRNYMDSYKKYGIWKSCKLAYYQGGTAMRNLAVSINANDRSLYNDFCQFVITRPIRSTH